MSIRRRAKDRRKGCALTFRSPKMITVLFLSVLLMLAAGCVGTGDSLPSDAEVELIEDISWFTIYFVIMTSVAVSLQLVLILMITFKMNRLVNKIDQISKDTGKFVQMGMTFFKKK